MLRSPSRDGLLNLQELRSANSLSPDVKTAADRFASSRLRAPQQRLCTAASRQGRIMSRPEQNGTVRQTADSDPLSGKDIRISGPNVELQALPEYLKKECLLFFYPDTESLAREIAAKSDNVELGNIKWRQVNQRPLCLKPA